MRQHFRIVTWENPRPDVPIRSLDFVHAKTHAVPILARLRGFEGVAAHKSLQIKPTTPKVFTTGLNWPARLKP